MSEANEPSADTTLICSKCGYAIKIKPHETPKKRAEMEKFWKESTPIMGRE